MLYVVSRFVFVSIDSLFLISPLALKVIPLQQYFILYLFLYGSLPMLKKKKIYIFINDKMPIRAKIRSVGLIEQVLLVRGTNHEVTSENN